MKILVFPGQGSQYKGMGKELFPKYKNETKLASDILGYDIVELCVNDPKKELIKTQFTQPALYVVNAFHYYEREKQGKADYLLGHSLGEYNALLAAGAFDFETGLKLVKKRGELMAAASGGSMAAVMGLREEELKKLLKEGGYDDIDVANYNTPSQTVISGPQKSIGNILTDFDKRGIRIIPLMVSAPFHSRYMKQAEKEFSVYLEKFRFSALRVPVIANATAKPYTEGELQRLLSAQISSSVRWTDSIRYIMARGMFDYEEIGGTILTKMIREIVANCTPAMEDKVTEAPSLKALNTEAMKTAMPPAENKIATGAEGAGKRELAARLGSKTFREDYGVKYAYVAGAMYRGIASKELVARMARANILSYLGTGGMTLGDIEQNIKYLKENLAADAVYGMNLLHNYSDPDFEMKTAEVYLKYGIKNIEAAAFMQVTRSLVLFRLKGLTRDRDGAVKCNHRILAKVSRPEVAEAFMRPAPVKIVNQLLLEGYISREEADMSLSVPMSYDICVEADSGGHTDRGVALVLLPAIQELRKRVQAEFNYDKKIRVGLAGGIGTPQSASCAYIMGADFIMTGSINQCTVEAGTSDAVKSMLQEMNVQDTDYAPAGDMFEIGAKVQVLKKGILFSVRANKLYSLYSQHSSLEEIPAKTIEQLEKSYFKKTIDEVWRETKLYFESKGKHREIEKAEKDPKHKMNLVFRWYFWYCGRLAMQGDKENTVNFQVHTGPALGAFNQWVKGTSLEDWRNRHVDQIGIRIMEETAELLKSTLAEINTI